MSGRPPLPWWKRKQATLVAEAARRAGLTATARLEGWLEISDVNGEVASGKFNLDTGSMLHAHGWTADTNRRVEFRKDGTAYFTGREAVDGFTAWLAAGRLAAFDAAGTVRTERAYTLADRINAVIDERPDAVVSDITTRRKR